ncbi:hypothetical protein HOLleu_14044 [Holothuria leucospilota]|uniref:Sulfotransferase n=1 Tax=Holothuria leucospilota TaxID=206669 RepID=A0A9Q1C854_HOLLE|nr:hypothetical protein HOLleu_14044 [Holothuria leucospilota]
MNCLPHSSRLNFVTRDFNSHVYIYMPGIFSFAFTLMLTVVVTVEQTSHHLTMANSESTKDHGNRMFLWCSARSLSSVFTKCVSFMEGAQVWFEPYTSCYLNFLFSEPENMAKFPKLNSMEGQIRDTTEQMENFDHYFDGGNLTPSSRFNSYDWLQEQLEKPLAEGKSFMFVKEAALCVDGFYEKLPRIPFRHTFIIRDPCKTAKSCHAMFIELYEHKGTSESFDMYQSNPFLNWDRMSRDPLYSLWKYVKESLDPQPVVIDADDLQNYPDQILRKYCEAVGIPYKEKYVEWPESDKSLKYCYGPLDQMVWGKRKHVYGVAFESSCFRPIGGEKPAFEDLTPDAKRFAKELREGYEEMYPTRIKPAC